MNARLVSLPTLEPVCAARPGARVIRVWRKGSLIRQARLKPGALVARLRRFWRRLLGIAEEVWVVLELSGGEPQFVTWTPDEAEALQHYRARCDASDMPYDDPHTIEVDVYLFRGRRGEALSEHAYGESAA